MKKLLLTGIAVLLLATGAAHAIDVNTSAVIWYRPCKSNLDKSLAYTPMDKVDAIWCEDFVKTQARIMGAIKVICPPEGTTSDQFIRVVVNAMDKDLDALHMPFGELVDKALKKAWPCK